MKGRHDLGAPGENDASKRPPPPPPLGAFEYLKLRLDSSVFSTG